MKKEDANRLGNAIVLLIVGYFMFSIILYPIAIVLCNKVENKTTLVTVVKILAIIGLVINVLYFLINL